MPIVSQHTPGMFCWADLSTTSQDGARRFYTELMGWSTEEIPLGPGQTYTMLRKEGRQVAALSQLEPVKAEQGIPSHWMNYVCVRSADEAAQMTESLGGAVLAPAFDVFDAGRMAVLRDPTGAILAVWQPRSHAGAQVYGDPGSLVWAELLTRDTTAAERFYTALFAWGAQLMPMPTGNYTVFTAGGQPAGGMMAIGPEMGPIPPHWMVYFAVESCAATVERARGLGANVLLAPHDIPEVGVIATLADPQGATFSLLQPAPRAS